MNIDGIIDSAIKMEEEGYDFYKKAETRTKSALGRLMFATLAEDEVKHKNLLHGLKKKMPADARELDVPLPKERLRSVFADAKSKINEKVTPTTDDTDALVFAMTKETESHDLYKKAADESADPKVKAVFERMALEENHHYEILQETKYFLEQYNNWSIWEEGGPIEGG
jgi:rubrerythrin